MKNFKKVFLVSLTATLVFGGFFVAGGAVLADGSIATYDNPTCTLPAVDSFSNGDTVYLGGSGFGEGKFFNWSITGNVNDYGASDTGSGTFCIPTHVVGELDSGSFHVHIQAADEDSPFFADTDYSVTILDTTPPAVPTLVSPASGSTLPAAGLILDWSDVTDDSSPVTYYYESSLSAATGANNALTSVIYGPVSTSTNSQIDASGSAENIYYWQVKACDSVGNCSDWSGPWSITVNNTPAGPVAPSCISENTFDNFSLGSVNGQNGWSATGPYDQAIVSNIYGYSTFGCQSLRVSDSTASGSFGDWIFAKPLDNAVGETDATAGAFSVGSKKDFFQFQFDIASTVPGAQQPGLHLSVSPDRGDGSRMSYLRFEDGTTGMDVFFDDVQGTENPANFVETQIATGIDRTIPHTIKLTFQAVDGPSNDIVNVYIDGALVHTGTSWENYYRFDSEAAAEQSPRIVKTVIFQARGSSTPADLGNGFLFDNIDISSSLSSGPVFIENGIPNHIHDAGELYFSTIQEAVDYATAGDFIQVAGDLTYTEHVVVNKSVTISGANWDVFGNGTRVGESVVNGTDSGAPFAIQANDVTITGFTIENGSGGGLNSGIYSYTGTEGFSITNNIITGNDFGVWAQCNGNCLISHNLFDGNNKEGPGTDSISADSTNGLTISDNEFKNDSVGNPILLQAEGPGMHKGIVISGNYFHNNTNASTMYLLGINVGTFSNNIIHPPVDRTGLYFAGADNNVTVTGNVITGGFRGILVQSDYYGANNDIHIHNNSITGNTEGINIVASAENNVTVNFNDISGNVISLYFGNSEKTLNAENNWFGCAAGPAQIDDEDPTPEAATTCGVISHDNNIVDFSPWLATLNLSGNNPITGQIINSDGVAVGFDTGLKNKFTATGANPQPSQTIAIGTDNTALYNVNLIGPNPGDTTAGDMVLFADQNSTLINTLVINTPTPPVPPTPPSSGGGGGGGGGGHGNFTAYTITASSEANGSITPVGSTSVNSGSNVAFTVTPNVGFQVQDVLVDGVSVGPVTNYTFNSINTNHTILARFSGVAGISTTSSNVPTPPNNSNPPAGGGNPPETSGGGIAGGGASTGPETPAVGEETAPQVNDSQTENTDQTAALSTAPGLQGLLKWIGENWPWLLLWLIILLIAYYLYREWKKSQNKVK